MAADRPSAGLTAALARIVSGRCVSTYRDAEDVDRSSPPSFVRQAGFAPPRI